MLHQLLFAVLSLAAEQRPGGYPAPGQEPDHPAYPRRLPEDAKKPQPDLTDNLSCHILSQLADGEFALQESKARRHTLARFFQVAIGGVGGHYSWDVNYPEVSDVQVVIDDADPSKNCIRFHSQVDPSSVIYTRCSSFNNPQDRHFSDHIVARQVKPLHDLSLSKCVSNLSASIRTDLEDDRLCLRFTGGISCRGAGICNDIRDYRLYFADADALNSFITDLTRAGLTWDYDLHHRGSESCRWEPPVRTCTPLSADVPVQDRLNAHLRRITAGPPSDPPALDARGETPQVAQERERQERLRREAEERRVEEQRVRAEAERREREARAERERQRQMIQAGVAPTKEELRALRERALRERFGA